MTQNVIDNERILVDVICIYLMCTISLITFWLNMICKNGYSKSESCRKQTLKKCPCFKTQNKDTFLIKMICLKISKKCNSLSFSGKKCTFRCLLESIIMIIILYNVSFCQWCLLDRSPTMWRVSTFLYYEECIGS